MLLAVTISSYFSHCFNSVLSVVYYWTMYYDYYYYYYCCCCCCCSVNGCRDLIDLKLLGVSCCCSPVANDDDNDDDDDDDVHYLHDTLMNERCRGAAEIELQRSGQSLQIAAARQVHHSVIIVIALVIITSSTSTSATSASVHRGWSSSSTDAVAERLRRASRLFDTGLRQETTCAERRRRTAGRDLQRRGWRQLRGRRRFDRRRQTGRRWTGFRRRTIGRFTGRLRDRVRRGRRRLRRAWEKEEKDENGVFSQSGFPARVDVRHEALPVELGARRSGRRLAPHRNSSQDLVPEQAQQVEEAVGGRAGGGQHGSRCAATCPSADIVPSSTPAQRSTAAAAGSAGSRSSATFDYRAAVGQRRDRLECHGGVVDRRTG